MQLRLCFSPVIVAGRESRLFRQYAGMFGQGLRSGRNPGSLAEQICFILEEQRYGKDPPMKIGRGMRKRHLYRNTSMPNTLGIRDGLYVEKTTM